MGAKTIGELSAELKNQLVRMRIAPAGTEIASVSLLSGSKPEAARKKRANASAAKSFGAGDSIFITLREAPVSAGAEQHLEDLLQTLAEAERIPQYAFVALKWLRDTYLPGRHSWAASPEERDRVLRRAIDMDLIRVHRVPNPKHPEFPTSSLQLNRAHAEVQRLFGPHPAKWDFTPIKIEGEPASVTLRRMRDGD
ncbi:MAG: hypothetical protein EPN33_13110 [Acidobacteria bacterium]|nr:MAG: hypothetical protein EPN33_13110 [Acidobacteriota bacterium]